MDPLKFKLTIAYDGTAYQGGNGVTYAGFVNGENPSVLTGALAYTGSSQGAQAVGTYTLAPTGQNALNYALRFASAMLTIQPNASYPTVRPNAAYLGAVSGMNRQGYLSDSDHLRSENMSLSGSLTLDIVDGGMRLPEGLGESSR